MKSSEAVQRISVTSMFDGKSPMIGFAGIQKGEVIH